MSKITTVVAKNASSDTVAVVGIDLAKNVFAVHGINAAGKPVLVKPAVRRDQPSRVGTVFVPTRAASSYAWAR